jgi:tetratricopeptide (TPR) repeat protein
MIWHARIVCIFLALAASSAGARADNELLKTVPPEGEPPMTAPPGAAPSLPEAPKAKPKPEAAPPAGVWGQQRGDPGMMGLPWPKSPDEAKKTLNKLYVFLASTTDHRLAGEIGAAIERLWRLQGGPTVNLLIDRGEIFSSKNENEKALPFLDAAVDLAPDYADAWSHRAYIEYRLQNYRAALGDLRRALALDPRNFRALDATAKTLEIVGEKKAALKAYDQLLKIHPNIEGGQAARDKLREEVEGQGI